MKKFHEHDNKIEHARKLLHTAILYEETHENMSFRDHIAHFLVYKVLPEDNREIGFVEKPIYAEIHEI